MHRFKTTLVPGSKPPYSTWTFLIIPAELAAAWGAGPVAVRGTIAGATFRGTASRGEGELRMPVPRDLRERAAVSVGESVEVAIELDEATRPLEIPVELRAVFDEDPEVAQLFERLPPSHQRSWAAYVGDAKRQETRVRRARQAPLGIRTRQFPR